MAKNLATPHDWLLLIHRVPARPLYLRAKIRALLARAGAAPLKKAVYGLPRREGALAALQVVADEIRGSGGEAFILEARFVATEDEAILRAAFEKPSRSAKGRWTGRRWVTRAGILVDRIACAWFIRRYLDPSARIRFAAAPATRRDGEIGFDMPGAEFSHENGGCSLETLMAKTGIRDPGLDRVARIVHQLDLKDGRFDLPEAAGVQQLLAGVVAAHAEDEARLERGMALFDDLHRSFGGPVLRVPHLARPKSSRPRREQP